MVEALQNLWTSITGNMKVRINDPFIGAFFCSWILCNWSYIGLLFFGDGTASERISGFYIYLNSTDIFAWNSLFIIPFSLSIFYLFMFPWVSLCVKRIQRKVNDRLYQQAVEVDLEQIKQSEELNKARLKANPNKQFLEQLTQFDIDKKKEVLEHIKLRTTRLEAKAKEALAQKQHRESKAALSKLDLNKRTQQKELEKIRFEANSAKARAKLASHRFPSVYYLMSLIESSLKQDGIKVSMKGLGDIVAALFGYDSFDSLLEDQHFNNENLDLVNYVYYDDKLAKRLEEIVLNERSNNEDFSADLIFEHLEVLFEDEPFELITIDRLAEYSQEQIENNAYEIFNCDGTSGAIAESDTIFDSIDDITIEDFYFDTKSSRTRFISELSVNTSGEHRKEEGVPGRTMTVSIKMESNVIVGKYGLSAIEFGKIDGSLDEFE